MILILKSVILAETRALCLSLLTVLLLLFALSAQAGTIYVDAEKGDDSRSGTDAENAVQTLPRAVALVAESGTIHLIPRETPFRAPLALDKGGREGAPLVIEGNGAVIDLGTDVTDGPWVPDGDAWILDRETRPSTRPHQVSSIFVDNTPVWVHREGLPRAPGDGELRILEDGRFAVVFPPGKSPENSVVTLTSDEQESAVSFGRSNSHIVVRDLTVRFSGNDGFNLHGDGREIVLENVRALMCGDQGISSHGTAEMHINGAEIAFCGSRAGGIADVHDCRTSYRNVLLHNNRRAGLHFTGEHHQIDGMILLSDDAAALPRTGGNLEVKNFLVLGSELEVIASVEDTDKETLSDLIEAAREALSKTEVVPYPGVSRSLQPDELGQL